MALAGRSARRGGAGIRWITIGVAIILLILLLDAALHSRSSAPQQELATGTWIDRVLPLISSSTVEGQTIAGIWAHGLKMPGADITQEIDSVASGANANYQTASKLRPPAALTAQAGLLDASLLARSKAAGELKSALIPVLGPAADPASPDIQAVQKSGSDIQVADEAYRLFAGSMPPNLGVKMPASVWGADMAPYQPQRSTLFLASLRNAVAATPVHQVKIYALNTNPAPVTARGSTEIMPDAAVMTMAVVVADTGNQPEKNVNITATITPAGFGGASARRVVNLQPGQAQTIVGLGPLRPLLGPLTTLRVKVTGASGQLAEQDLVFQMPPPPPPRKTTRTT